MSSWQTVKQVLSEMLAVYVKVSSELEEQSKQLLQKVKQANSSLKDSNGEDLQGKYLHVWKPKDNIRWNVVYLA